MEIEIVKTGEKYTLFRHDLNAHMRSDITMFGGPWLWDRAPAFDCLEAAAAFVEQNAQYML